MPITTQSSQRSANQLYLAQRHSTDALPTISASTMPASGQPTNNDAADLLDFDPHELNNLVTERRRTDSDRSNLGIPADNNNFFHRQHTPLTDFQSASQASVGQGSWERVSATSHGTSYFLWDGVYDQHSQPGSTSLTVGISPSYMMFNEWSSIPVYAANNYYTRPDAGSPRNESPAPSHLAYSQPPADSSDPPRSIPQTSSPEPDYSNLSTQCMKDLDLAGPVHFDGSQDDSLAFTGSEFAQFSSSVEPSGQTYHLNQGLEQLNPAETHGSSPEAAIEPSSALALHCKQMPDANLHISHIEENQKLSEPQKTKRKRQTASKRNNLEGINLVRDRGACIRCAVLHEKVSYKAASYTPWTDRL